MEIKNSKHLRKNATQSILAWNMPWLRVSFFQVDLYSEALLTEHLSWYTDNRRFIISFWETKRGSLTTRHNHHFTSTADLNKIFDTCLWTVLFSCFLGHLKGDHVRIHSASLLENSSLSLRRLIPQKTVKPAKRGVFSSRVFTWIKITLGIWYTWTILRIKMY